VNLRFWSVPGSLGCLPDQPLFSPTLLISLKKLIQACFFLPASGKWAPEVSVPSPRLTFFLQERTFRNVARAAKPVGLRRSSVFEAGWSLRT